MSRAYFFFFFILGFAVIAGGYTGHIPTAVAAEKKPEEKPAGPITRIDVSLSENQDYDRLVVSVRGNPNHELITVEPGQLSLAFSSNASADLFGFRDNPGRFIKDITIESAMNTPMILGLSVFPSSRVRHFQVGNRIFVDVYQPEDAKERIEAQKQTDDRQQEEKVAEQTEKAIVPPAESLAPVQEVAGEETTNPTEAVQDAQETTEPETDPVQQTEEGESSREEDAPIAADAPDILDEGAVAADEAASALAVLPVDSHAVTLTSTQTFGLAVYERYGRVWFVIDNPDAQIMPQLLGQDTQRFSELERYNFASGQAFSLDVPEEMKIRVEGGGLSWRVVLSPQLAVPDKTIIEKRIGGGQFQNGEVNLFIANAQSLVRLPDPMIGDALAVVTVSRSSNQVTQAMQFVDLDILPSYAGAAIRPQSDGMRVKVTGEGEVKINRQNGLSLSETEQEMASEFLEGRQTILPEDRIYNFAVWSLGPRRPFANRVAEVNKSLQGLADPVAFTDNRDASLSLLIRAGKFYLSQSMPQEALGFFRMARQIAPELSQSPEFVSLRGAAYALSGYLRQARRDFNHPALDSVDEVRLWKSFIASQYNRLEQAYELLPVDLNPLLDYPAKMRAQMAFAFSEVARHAGDAEMIRTLVQMVRMNEAALSPSIRQGAEYYEAVASLTRNLPAEAYALFEAVEDSEETYFATKAAFMRLTDQLDRGFIDQGTALEQMERLRYAWRGDYLEADILKALGNLYIDNDMPHKGLATLRQAVSQIRDRRQRDAMTALMRDAFVDIFTREEGSLPPLEAITLFEEFEELTPPGQVGDQIMANLVDLHVDVDLLDRAVGLLRQLSEERLTGDAAEQATLRMVGILLMDKKPRRALENLNEMDQRFGEAIIQRPPPPPPAPVIEEEPIDPSLTPMVQRAIQQKRDEARALELELNPPPPQPVYVPEPQNPLHLKREILKAKALSDTQAYEEALTILQDLPQDGGDVIRLMADTAWRAGEWGLAAQSFQEFLNTEDVGDALTITKEHQAVILNMAIALSLAENRAELAAIRDEYSPEMASSPLYQSFQIITRPNRGGALADRETLLSLVAEVDLFGDFLAEETAL